MTGALSYILSCLRTLAHMFPTMFEPTEIKSLIVTVVSFGYLLLKFLGEGQRMRTEAGKLG